MKKIIALLVVIGGIIYVVRKANSVAHVDVFDPKAGDREL